MSFTDHIRKLRPRFETYIPVVEKVQSIISESSLSKSQLQKLAGKGPNSGTPRIDIFAKKIADGEDHILSDGSTIKITQIFISVNKKKKNN